MPTLRSRGRAFPRYHLNWLNVWLNPLARRTVIRENVLLSPDNRSIVFAITGDPGRAYRAGLLRFGRRLRRDIQRRVRAARLPSFRACWAALAGGVFSIEAGLNLLTKARLARRMGSDQQRGIRRVRRGVRNVWPCPIVLPVKEIAAECHADVCSGPARWLLDW